MFDAYCPHLGAHLGRGGKVIGTDLQCPFHAWQFNGDGKCVRVPYANKIPAKAEVKSWPVLERNGRDLRLVPRRGEGAGLRRSPRSPEWGDAGWTSTLAEVRVDREDLPAGHHGERHRLAALPHACT